MCLISMRSGGATRFIGGIDARSPCNHDPLVREHFAPNGRHENWEYTSMEIVRGSALETILGFSRPTTVATERMKEQLAARGVEVRRVERPNRLP